MNTGFCHQMDFFKKGLESKIIKIEHSRYEAQADNGHLNREKGEGG